jgi:glycerophosphoryl diester phosphodiesterase
MGGAGAQGMGGAGAAARAASVCVVRSEPRLRRVGHKGADRLVPGNTRESFDAALRAGVDMIEFDVLPEPPVTLGTVREAERAGRRGAWRDSRLVLAHDWIDARRRADVALSLAEGLDHLASAPFADVELDLDLKLPGYEHAVVRALRERGLVGRTLVSSHYRDSLRLIRREEPALRLGWSVPLVRRDPFRHAALIPLVGAAVAAGRALLPARAAAILAGGGVDAIMANYRLVTPRLVEAVRAAGGDLYVWTVGRLEAMGVTGVISNDPRLFRAVVPGGVTG